MSSETVILAGVAVGLLFSSLLSLIKYVTPQERAFQAIVLWLLGGLHTANWDNILVCCH
jgi:iron complex transport system permease protein